LLKKTTCLNTLLRDVARFFESSTSDNGIEIITEFAEDDLCVMTDPVLVKRVAINMVKNACEASVEGQKVKIGFSRTSDSVVIKVHNESSIPEEVSSSIFKRSFSTKGEGRGLGTYSMRLLTERYLQGKIYFTSNKKSGTTFYAELPVS